MTVTVVIPSRGRPLRAAEAVAAIQATQALPDTRVIVAVDEDDPTLPEYLAMLPAELRVLRRRETGNLVRATNTVSLEVAAQDPAGIIGNLGDDHRARTQGWDHSITETLRDPGIAYGDDLLQGVRLPTAPFISARIVNALGWYALPTCVHTFIDDAWRELGTAIERLHYLPDLVFEHLHPAVGKGAYDAGYERSDESIPGDRAAYNEWMMRYLKVDAANVRKALR